MIGCRREGKRTLGAKSMPDADLIDLLFPHLSLFHSSVTQPTNVGAFSLLCAPAFGR